MIQGAIRVLLVGTGTRRSALPIEHVEETMRPLPVEPMASAPPFVRGLAVIRGAPVPVVDLEALLGGAPGAAFGRFVTVKAGGHRRVALAVDQVIGVATLERGRVEALPPLLAQAGAERIDAVGALDAELLVVLQAARLLPEEVWAAVPGAEAAS